MQVQDSLEERMLLARMKKEDATTKFKEKVGLMARALVLGWVDIV